MHKDQGYYKWKQTMEHYFPNTAWLRVSRDTFGRLSSGKTRNGLPTWEAAREGLLRVTEREDES